MSGVETRETRQQGNLYVVSSPKELESLGLLPEEVAKKVAMEISGNNTMVHFSWKDLERKLRQGRAVIVVEETKTGYKPVGFCGLSAYSETPNPKKRRIVKEFITRRRIVELGSIIKFDTEAHNVGYIAALAALQLPYAENADHVIAYCNEISFHMMTKGLQKRGFPSARIISDEEAIQLGLDPSWTGDKSLPHDTLVDLKPIMNNATRALPQRILRRQLTAL